MKPTIIFFIAYFINTLMLQSQSFDAKLVNHQPGFPEMDVIIMPFDMSYRVSIGKLKTDGILEIKLPEFSEIQLPSNVSNDDLSELRHVLDFKCADPSSLKTSKSVRAFNGGYVALWHNTKRNGWAGSVFAVSDTALIPWLEDDAYMQPVKASYYKLIYVSEAVVVKTTCKDSWKSLDFDIPREYNFDLDLKKGYNFIAYHLQEIYDTKSDDITNKPSKINITSVTDFSKIIWKAKYF